MIPVPAGGPRLGYAPAGLPHLELRPDREARLGSLRVRRALPRRERRTVGAWCFLDHIGPTVVTADSGTEVAPHPHMGLQTVTWLLSGELLHRDSLGTEQVVRPGELNLMTAGHGVAHSEERTGGAAGVLHGAQLWVAQPSATRDGPAAFAHHRDLPSVDLGHGATATLLVGELAGAVSPARRDTAHVGADLDLHRGHAVLPLQVGWEYALVVLAGAVEVEGRMVTPGHLAYLGAGRDEAALVTRAMARCLLVGGVPFPEPVRMWWNFVGRTAAELETAQRDWAAGAARFGEVASALPRIEVGPPPWAGAAGATDGPGAAD